tara:strand:+ start:165 stop:1046 length:882 start_codon:yes stop_codon:yes gene_type:complete
MAIDKKITYEDQRLTKAQQKKAKPVKSAGIKNYLGKQETVTVPKKWLSSPDHVVAELAYITPREQKILLDANLYGSLNGKPNRGPGGIMSLQGAGDGGGSENAGTNDDGSSSGGGTGPSVEAPPGVTANPSAPTDGTEGTLSDPREKFDYKVGDTVFGPIGNTGPSFIDKAISLYSKLPTPFNIAKKVLTNLGPFNNKDFYNEKVVPAGRTNLGYDDYMSARMAGTIDAYGNPKDTGRGGDNNQSTLNSGIAGIQDINIIGEEVIDPTNTASTQDMDFNFGTYSNPIYKKDLV